MVPSNLHKLLRSQSQSATKTFSLFSRSLLPPFSSPALAPVPRIPNSTDPLALPNPPKSDVLKQHTFFSGHVYPSFSWNLFLNPNSSTSVVRSVFDDEPTEDDSRVIRADSVKKKRKKKMNKHKLKKLRKRLRRKT